MWLSSCHLYHPFEFHQSRVPTWDDLLGEAGGDDPAVGQWCEDGSRVPQHAANAQHQQHEEVEHRVQLGHLHIFDRFWIDYKCQSRPLDSLMETRGETELQAAPHLDKGQKTQKSDSVSWQSTPEVWLCTAKQVRSSLVYPNCMDTGCWWS